MSIFKNSSSLKRSLEAQFGQVIALNIDSDIISAKAIIDDAEMVVFNGVSEVIERQKVASIFTSGLTRRPRSGDLLTWGGIDYRLNKLIHEDFAELRFSLVKVGSGSESRNSAFDVTVNSAKLGQLAVFGESIALNIDDVEVTVKAIIDDAEIVVFNGVSEVIERQKVASIFTSGLTRRPRSGDLLTWGGIDYRLNKLIHEDFAELRFSLLKAFDVVPVNAVTHLGVPIKHLGNYVVHA
jgi:hypothetical protein